MKLEVRRYDQKATMIEVPAHSFYDDYNWGGFEQAADEYIRTRLVGTGIDLV